MQNWWKNGQIGTLTQRIAALEGKTREQTGGEGTFDRGKELNQKFSQIQNYFKVNEVEVYKQGSQLIIRLKAIQLPVTNRTLPYDRIVAVGYGSTRPLASNETAAGRAINRRIDVVVKP